jgi:hypothetical protein
MPDAPVFFQGVQLVTDSNPRRLDPIRAPGAPEPPEAMRALMRDLDAIGRVVTRVFDTAPESRRRLFDELHATARLGLVGANPSIELAQENVAEIRGHLADEFPAVRDRLWRQNLVWIFRLALWALPGALLYAAVLTGYRGLSAPTGNGDWNPYIAWLLALFWIPLGTAIGVFLEFSYSVDRELTFDDIVKINPGRWQPGQRLVNTVATGFVFAFIMGIGAVKIGVLSVLLNDFADRQPLLSLAVGFVSGFAFPYVRDIIYRFRPVQK